MKLAKKRIYFSLLAGGFVVPEPQTSHYLLASFSPVSSSTQLQQTFLFIDIKTNFL
jgi:hypothetical protein